MSQVFLFPKHKLQVQNNAVCDVSCEKGPANTYCFLQDAPWYIADGKPDLHFVLIAHSCHALTCLYFLLSVWTEEAQCSLLNASITETFNCSFSCGPDCWKISQYPCLQVYVNLTSSGQKLLLYHTEETMKINSEVGGQNKISS